MGPFNFTRLVQNRGNDLSQFLSLVHQKKTSKDMAQLLQNGSKLYVLLSLRKCSCSRKSNRTCSFSDVLTNFVAEDEYVLCSPFVTKHVHPCQATLPGCSENAPRTVTSAVHLTHGVNLRTGLSARVRREAGQKLCGGAGLVPLVYGRLIVTGDWSRLFAPISQCRCWRVQGYLAHRKTPPQPRTIVGS